MTNSVLPHVSPSTQKVLVDPLASISAKLFHLISLFEHDLSVLELDGETVILEAQRMLNRTLSPICSAKMLMGVAALNSDVFFVDCQAFIDFANLSAGETPPAPGVFEPANASECGVAVAELMLINHLGDDLAVQPTDDDPQFSDEIRKYWGGILVSEGVFQPVAPMWSAIIQSQLDFDDPSLYVAVDGSSRAAASAISNDIRSYVWKALGEIATVKTHDGKNLLTEQEISKLFVALTGK